VRDPEQDRLEHERERCIPGERAELRLEVARNTSSSEARVNESDQAVQTGAEASGDRNRVVKAKAVDAPGEAVHPVRARASVGGDRAPAQRPPTRSRAGRRRAEPPGCRPPAHSIAISDR
jgi:hypothetical protein